VSFDPEQSMLTTALKLAKPKGKIILDGAQLDAIKSKLTLTGFVNIGAAGGQVYAEKPNYEIGSSAKLSFAGKNKEKIAAVWKITDDDDEEAIDPDELLDDEDKLKPDPSTLRVCGTTGKRKACKDCSCGLAEELATEQNGKVDPNPTQKSSCGSVC
jgi:anamorsin